MQESPQVFGIARLSEVRTIQISHKKNPILWVEKGEKQQIRDSCALYLYVYVCMYIYTPRGTMVSRIRKKIYFFVQREIWGMETKGTPTLF